MWKVTEIFFPDRFGLPWRSAVFSILLLACWAPAQTDAAITLASPGDYFLVNNPHGRINNESNTGTQYYSDRTYRIRSQPSGFESYSLIITQNDDKNVTDCTHIQLSLTQPATLYVAYDRRASDLPTWLRSFTGTGESVYSDGDGDMSYFRLYSKSYPAGEVTLGGNKCDGGTGAGSNYIVYIREETEIEPLSVDPAAMSLSPGDLGTAAATGGTTPYHAATSNALVATATIAGGEVTVTAVGDGTAVITITDSSSPARSVTLQVTVTTALSLNPEALNLISGGGVGTSTITGGTPPYEISGNSNPSAAAAVMDGDSVTVTADHVGSTVITITDAASASVYLGVQVYARLTVNPSVLNLNPGDSGNSSASGGSGAYSAISNNIAVATVSVSGSTVIVTAVSEGSISVTVRDQNDATNTATMVVNVGGSGGIGLGDCPSPPFITGSGASPNILLILDHSGSMGNDNGHWGEAKTVVQNILDEFPDVRFGLMRMDGSDTSGNDYWYSSAKVIRQGGKVLRPCGTPRDEIKTYIANWGYDSNVPQTWTNLAETLASAGQYFSTVIQEGARVGKGPSGFGFYEKNYQYRNGGTVYDATTTDDKGNTIQTTSPIDYPCQKSFIIFITDGLSNNDDDWPIVTHVAANDTNIGVTGANTRFDDVARFLKDNDMRSDVAGTQNILTYVIGFHIDDTLLSSTAALGGGRYYTTTSSSGLAEALRNAVQNILASISSGTAVATISTSAETADSLIRAKFLPIVWRGYLESFSLPYTEGSAPLWEAGQALADASSSGRRIYTFMSTEVNKKQAFTSSNGTVKDFLASQWGVSVTEAGKVMGYIRGDTTYEGTAYRNREGWKLGDIIHSTPISVGPPKFYYTENDYPDFKADHGSRQKIIYVGANDGMLHAFSADTGAESWAFIPENILADLIDLTHEDCHLYLVDQTPVAADIHDGSNWKTVLVGGNRLGGNEFFCLDVTDPSDTGFSILWDLIPFSNRKSSTTPVIGKIKGGAVDKWAAVVTSGYHEGSDPGKIAALSFTNGAKETVWSSGGDHENELSTQAKSLGHVYYTLSSPVGVDTDYDGYLDLIYAGDTEGSLWKFFYDYEANIWQKTELFKTGGQAITAKPTLVFDETQKIRIFFGTGQYMVGDDKMNTVQNALYCIIDDPVETTDANDGHYTGTTTIRKNEDLVDLTGVTTDLEFASLSDDDKNRVDSKGWYFELDVPVGPGERVLDPALVLSGIAFFTSFVPNQDICGYGGDSRLYSVHYKTGLPGRENNHLVLEGMEEGERYVALGPGLPSKPVFYYDREARQSKLIVATSDTTIYPKTIRIKDNPMVVTSWREEEQCLDFP